MPDKKSAKIVEEIFGPDGLTSLDTSVSFSEKKLRKLNENTEKILDHTLHKKLIPTIKCHVFDISKSDKRIPLNWENNHCEARNHILKLNLNWKLAKIPGLVKMLKKKFVSVGFDARSSLWRWKF